jgi:Ca2+-binding EF-hand superfamily protein
MATARALRRAAAGFLMGISTLQPLAAQEPPPPVITTTRPSPYDPVDPQTWLLAQIRKGSTLESYLAQLMAPFRRYDRDGDGLDGSDAAAATARSNAEARARLLAEVLKYDLDQDQQVTGEEIRNLLDLPSGPASHMVTTILGRYDANNDGKVVLRELVSAELEKRHDHRSTEIERLMALDPNKDGRLTAAELRDIGERSFASLDEDGNLLISEQEDGLRCLKVTLASESRVADRMCQRRLCGPGTCG